MDVIRPVFMVGCGRSGTTLLYELVAGHAGFAWFSNFTQRWPGRPELAALSRVRRIEAVRRLGWRAVPRPAEGHAIFDRCRGGERPADNAPLTEADLQPGEAAALQRVAADHLRFQGGERFLNKNTRNTRRVRYIDAAFPDAQFVHLVREPRSTTASLLEVGFWPDLPIWWAGERTPTQLEASGADPVAVAAEFWRREVEQVLTDVEHLGTDRVHTLRYEDLVGDVEGTLAALFEFMDVPMTPAFVASVRERAVTNRNAKAATKFDARQLTIIDSEVAPIARSMGYGLPA